MGDVRDIAGGRIPLQEYHLTLADREWVILHAGLMLTPADENNYFDNPLPYGIALWPSAIALSYELTARADDLLGRRVLELGAGTGLPGLVAAHAGAHVVQTDYQDHALSLCALNAQRNSVQNIELRQVDWTGWDDAQQYDYIIGSDILYADSMHPHLLRIFQRNLHPEGHVLLADPLRLSSKGLLDTLDSLGWGIDVTAWTIGEGDDARGIGLFDLTPTTVVK